MKKTKWILSITLIILLALGSTLAVMAAPGNSGNAPGQQKKSQEQEPPSGLEEPREGEKNNSHDNFNQNAFDNANRKGMGPAKANENSALVRGGTDDNTGDDSEGGTEGGGTEGGGTEGGGTEGGGTEGGGTEGDGTEGDGTGGGTGNNIVEDTEDDGFDLLMTEEENMVPLSTVNFEQTEAPAELFEIELDEEFVPLGSVSLPQTGDPNPWIMVISGLGVAASGLAMRRKNRYTKSSVTTLFQDKDWNK